MVPRMGVGVNYFRWGEMEFLRVLALFRYSILRVVFRGSAMRILLACTPRISGFDTAGTACTRGFVLLMLPVLAVFGPTVLLIHPVLAVFRPPVPESSQYSEYIASVKHSEMVPRVGVEAYYFRWG